MTLGAKIQPIIILLTALIGLALGHFTPLGNISVWFIELFLMLLLYILFLGIDLKQLKHSFKNVKYTSVAVTINFLITPILAFALGKVFFGEYIDIRIGLLMLLGKRQTITR